MHGRKVGVHAGDTWRVDKGVGEVKYIKEFYARRNKKRCRIFLWKLTEVGLLED
jgi:hypothetical protein